MAYEYNEDFKVRVSAGSRVYLNNSEYIDITQSMIDEGEYHFIPSVGINVTEFDITFTEASEGGYYIDIVSNGTKIPPFAVSSKGIGGEGSSSDSSACVIPQNSPQNISGLLTAIAENVSSADIIPDIITLADSLATISTAYSGAEKNVNMTYSDLLNADLTGLKLNDIVMTIDFSEVDMGSIYAYSGFSIYVAENPDDSSKLLLYLHFNGEAMAELSYSGFITDEPIQTPNVHIITDFNLIANADKSFTLSLTTYLTGNNPITGKPNESHTDIFNGSYESFDYDSSVINGDVTVVGDVNRTGTIIEQLRAIVSSMDPEVHSDDVISVNDALNRIAEILAGKNPDDGGDDDGDGLNNPSTWLHYNYYNDESIVPDFEIEFSSSMETNSNNIPGFNITVGDMNYFWDASNVDENNPYSLSGAITIVYADYSNALVFIGEAWVWVTNDNGTVSVTPIGINGGTISCANGTVTITGDKLQQNIVFSAPEQFYYADQDGGYGLYTFYELRNGLYVNFDGILCPLYMGIGNNVMLYGNGGYWNYELDNEHSTDSYGVMADVYRTNDNTEVSCTVLICPLSVESSDNGSDNGQEISLIEH